MKRVAIPLVSTVILLSCTVPVLPPSRTLEGPQKEKAQSEFKLLDGESESMHFPWKADTLQKLRLLEGRRLESARVEGPKYTYRGLKGFRHIDQYTDAELAECSEQELSLIVEDQSLKFQVARELNSLGYKARVGLADQVVAKLPERGVSALRRHFRVLDAIPGVRVATPRMKMKVKFSVRKKPSRRLLYTPNDPYFGDQWAIEQINATAAWDDSTTRSASKIVAIIDSGAYPHSDFDYVSVGKDATPTYVDLFGGIHYGYTNNTEDGFGHGTFVAGIAAATANNSEGIASPSFKGIFMPMAINEARPDGDDYWSDNARAAVVWAIDIGAKLVNCSFGGTNPDSHLEYLVDYANARGIPVICATGNDGASSIYYPAKYSTSYSNVIAVGASDKNDSRWSSSNYGSGISLVAPGEDIISTTNDGGYGSSNGTSLATPLVTGTFATLWYVCGALPMWQVRDVLFATADDTVQGTGGTWNGETGFGRLDYGGALQFLKSSGVIYRWNTPGYDIHGWTKIPSEKFTNMEYEKIGFQVSSSSATGLAGLRRYFNSSTGDYMLSTTSGAPSGYSYQGIHGYIATTSGSGGMSTPVHAFSKSGSGHMYTTDSAEKDSLDNSGWTYEGVLGYAK